MAYIFYPYDGHVVVSRSPTTVPAVLSVADAYLSGILITEFHQSGDVAHQVVQTVGGPEYAFVFGDVLQELSLSFITFAARCSGGSQVSRSSGYATLLNFYNQKRATPKKLELITLTFLGVTIKGFLVGFEVSADVSNGSTVIRGSITLRGWHMIKNQQQEPVIFSYQEQQQQPNKNQNQDRSSNTNQANQPKLPKPIVPMSASFRGSIPCLQATMNTLSRLPGASASCTTMAS